MKRYIYSLFMMTLVIIGITSCSVDEGRNPGGDSKPNIVIYQFVPKAPYNSDNDILIRIAANSKVVEAYYLAEPTTEKDAHVASMGKDGYMDYVVKNGTRVEGISGASDSDVTVTSMIGKYTITVVAVNNNEKMSAETTFIGLEWKSIGKGKVISSFFKSERECEFYKSNPILKYKAIAPYPKGEDYNLVFDVADNNSITVSKQTIAASFENYTTLAVSGNGKLEGDKIKVNLKFTVDQGSFGDPKEETFILPSTEP